MSGKFKVLVLFNMGLLYDSSVHMMSLNAIMTNVATTANIIRLAMTPSISHPLGHYVESLSIVSWK